jgi:hypothetical protein
MRPRLKVEAATTLTTPNRAEPKGAIQMGQEPSSMSRHGMKIDDQTFYTERDLQMGLGIDRYSQDAERKAGRLRSVTRGDAIVYRGKDLLDWLAEAGQL